MTSTIRPSSLSNRVLTLSLYSLSLRNAGRKGPRLRPFPVLCSILMIFPAIGERFTWTSRGDMKTAIRQTSLSDSSPSGTASNLCSVEKESGFSHGSGCQVPVCSSSSASAISSLEGLLPVALSLLANITCPSAGDTMTPSSLGIGRSGSLQKLAKNAASINISTPKPGANP